MLQKLYKIFRSSFGIVSVIIVIVLWSAISYFGISYGKELFSNTSSDNLFETADTEASAGTENCNVVGINLHGSIYTYLPPKSDSSLIEDTDVVSSDDIVYYINQVKEDEKIKAILLEVDSYGGTPVS